MKNTIKMTLATIAVAGVMVCQQAGAIPVVGALTIKGGAVFDTPSLATAKQVDDFTNAQVDSRDGDFTSYVSVGDSVTMAEPWVFNPSTATSGLWSVGGFTFDLASSTIVLQNASFLIISGSGTVSGNGFDDTVGVWRFSTQAPSADGEFSFSASSAFVPDGGLTIALLGFALVGIDGLRRKLKA